MTCPSPNVSRIFEEYSPGNDTISSQNDASSSQNATILSHDDKQSRQRRQLPRNKFTDLIFKASVKTGDVKGNVAKNLTIEDDPHIPIPDKITRFEHGKTEKEDRKLMIKVLILDRTIKTECWNTLSQCQKSILLGTCIYGGLVEQNIYLLCWYHCIVAPKQ